MLTQLKCTDKTNYNIRSCKISYKINKERENITCIKILNILPFICSSVTLQLKLKTKPKMRTQES